MGIVAGKVMPRPRGPYDETTAYRILDMVTLNNKLWIAKKSNLIGVEPSEANRDSWMLAVDGTTDVNELATEIYEKFNAIDATFETVDARFENANTSITENSNSISDLDGRMAAAEETIATMGDSLTIETVSTAEKGNTKPITSGGVYNLLNSEMEFNGGANDYEYHKGSYSAKTGGITAQTFTNETKATSNGIRSRTMNSFVMAASDSLTLESNANSNADNTDLTSWWPWDSKIILNSIPGISFSVSGKAGASTIYFQTDAFACINDNTVDLGRANWRWKNIYANTSTITTSDAREKENIKSITVQEAKDLIMGLKPVSYKFINGTSDRTHRGLIAQEVESLIEEIGLDTKDFAGLIKTPREDSDGNVIDDYVYGLRYEEFIAPLIKMCQSLQNEVDDLKARLGGDQN